MKNLKKRLALLCTGLLTVLCGCTPIVAEHTEDLTVYATFYPLYALAEPILKGVPDVELKCLVEPQDGCLRSYDLSDWDAYLLSYDADGVISGGRGLESFSTLLQSSAGGNFGLAEVLVGLNLENGTLESTDDSHFNGENPHAYMSASCAEAILTNIADAMKIMDPKYSDIYESNLTEIAHAMHRLQSDIREHTTVCVNVRAAIMSESLLYAALEYGMEIVDIVDRESGSYLYENELTACLASFREKEAQVVLIEEQAPEALVSEITAAGFRVAKLDIMNAHTQEYGFDGYCNSLLKNAASVAAACSGT